DRLQTAADHPDDLEGPLAQARPGVPMVLVRRRGEQIDRVDLLPIRPPPGERRMLATLFAVASGFVLLGGWVWSERRDRLTRPFFLLCLSFAWLVKPLPSWGSATLASLHDLVLTAVSVVVPALWVHFFVFFPESRQRRAVAGVLRAMYATAGALFALALVQNALALAGLDT